MHDGRLLQGCCREAARWATPPAGCRGETLEEKSSLGLIFFYFILYFVVLFPECEGADVSATCCRLEASVCVLCLQKSFSLSLSLPAFQWQALTLTAFREDMTCSVSSHAHVNQNSQMLFMYPRGR